MLSMRRVGLIDSRVGNACVPAHRNVPPRDAARRTTSLRNARAAGDTPADLARLARTVRLKRPGLRDGVAFEADAVRRLPKRLNSLCARTTIMPKERVLDTIIPYACNDFELLLLAQSGHSANG